MLSSIGRLPRGRWVYASILTVATLVAAALPAWYIVAPNDANWTAVFFGFHPMLTVVVASAAVAVVGYRSWRSRWGMVRVWVAAALFPALAFIASAVGSVLWFRANVDAWLPQAVGFCDELRPRLEVYRREHGAYPASIDAVRGQGRPPMLLRGSFPWYEARESSYRFRIHVSRGLAFHGAEFDSASGRWSLPPDLGR